MVIIPQRYEYDCTVACIAMVLEKSYEEVSGYFYTNFDKAGLDVDLVRNTICEHGFSVIEKTCNNYLDVQKMSERMRIPFADIHIINVWRYADSKITHAVVMDKEGKLFDPTGNKEWKFYSVERVLGFYKE